MSFPGRAACSQRCRIAVSDAAADHAPMAKRRREGTARRWPSDTRARNYECIRYIPYRDRDRGSRSARPIPAHAPGADQARPHQGDPPRSDLVDHRCRSRAVSSRVEGQARTKAIPMTPPSSPRAGEAHTHKINAGCFPSCPAHYSRAGEAEGGVRPTTPTFGRLFGKVMQQHPDADARLVNSILRIVYEDQTM
jgi:hypothetical protein